MLRKTGEEAVKAITFSPETKNRARQECLTPFGTALSERKWSSYNVFSQGYSLITHIFSWVVPSDPKPRKRSVAYFSRPASFSLLPNIL